MKRTALDRFRQYRAKHYDKANEMAADLRLSEAQLSLLLSGKRRPGLDIAVRIEDVTGIPARSWANTCVGRSKSRKSQANVAVVAAQ